MIVNKKKTQAIFLSFALTMASLVIAFIYSIYVPRFYGTPAIINYEKVYTLEESNNIQIEIERQRKELMNKINSKSPQENFYDFSAHAILVTWLPWLLVPFLINLREKILLLFLLTVPVLTALLGLITWYGIPIFLSAILISNFLRSLVINQRG